MEETFSYQADTTTWPPDISQLQALATVVLAQWTLREVAPVRGIGLYTDSHQKQRLPLTKAEFTGVANEHPTCQTGRG